VLESQLAAMFRCLATPASAEDATDYRAELARRRREYLEWIVQRFGAWEPTMHPQDGRRWALNHARLALRRDVAPANRYFESFGPLPRDADIYFIRFLRTLLDFRDSPLLGEKAKAHIVGILKGWPKTPLSAEAAWPPHHTENHDLMHLTIGLFAEQYRGGAAARQVEQLKRALALRFERGFIEWNSKCYQYHFSNPLLTLVDHAPDENLRLANLWYGIDLMAALFTSGERYKVFLLV
jgi:hypothetical protein